MILVVNGIPYDAPIKHMDAEWENFLNGTQEFEIVKLHEHKCILKHIPSYSFYDLLCGKEAPDEDNLPAKFWISTRHEEIGAGGLVLDVDEFPAFVKMNEHIYPDKHGDQSATRIHHFS